MLDNTVQTCPAAVPLCHASGELQVKQQSPALFLPLIRHLPACIRCQEAYGTETNHHDMSKGETAALQHLKYYLLGFYFFLSNINQIHKKAFCF